MIFKTFITYLGFGALTQALAFAINVFLKQSFSSEVYVQIIASITMLDIFVRIAIFGQDSIIVRFKEYSSSKYLYMFLLAQLLFSLCIFALIQNLSSNPLSIGFIIGALYILFLTLFNIRMSKLVSNKEPLKYGFFSSAKFILILGILLLMPQQLKFNQAADYLLLIIAAHFLVLIPLYFKSIFNPSSLMNDAHKSPYTYYKYGFLFGILGILGVLANFIHRGLSGYVLDITYYADFVFMATIYYQISMIAPAIAKSLFPIYFQSSEDEQKNFDQGIYRSSSIIIFLTFLIVTVTHLIEFFVGELYYSHFFLVLLGSVVFTLQYSLHSAAIYKSPKTLLMISSNLANLISAIVFLAIFTPLSVDIIATGFLLMWFGNFIFQLYAHDWKLQNTMNLKLMGLNFLLLGGLLA